jgi:hypothetical protein
VVVFGSIFSAAAAATRLDSLGLESEPLRDAVRRSFHAYISCSPNMPPLVRGVWAWGQAVLALREYTLPKGWYRSDANNYSVVIDELRGIAIAVATGDEATGIVESSPTTRAPKGVSTMLAVVANQAQLSLFTESEFPVVAHEREDLVTWFLLIHRAKNEVRCELSLPSSMGTDGRIDAWHERIILDAVPVDGDEMQISVPEGTDINVDVQRRRA